MEFLLFLWVHVKNLVFIYVLCFDDRCFIALHLSLICFNATWNYGSYLDILLKQISILLINYQFNPQKTQVKSQPKLCNVYAHNAFCSLASMPQLKPQSLNTTSNYSQLQLLLWGFSYIFNQPHLHLSLFSCTYIRKVNLK